MGIFSKDYHNFGMEHFDGGDDRWDFNHDGKFSIFEESARRTYDRMMYENIFEDKTDNLDEDYYSDFGDDESEDDESDDDFEIDNFDNFGDDDVDSFDDIFWISLISFHFGKQ